MRISAKHLLINLCCASLFWASGVRSQEAQDQAQAGIDENVAPNQVDVSGVAADDDIATRLNGILAATRWYTDPLVSVDQGVVTLSGVAGDEEQKAWAGQLAANTQDVVAVINRITVAEQPLWDLSPAFNEVRRLGREGIRATPLIVLGLVLLLVTWLAARWTVVGTRRALERRIRSKLLSNVVARAMALPVFLIGIYLVLQVSGLTSLAMTVVGGTGLLGLIIGFAFRDIAENFLASVLISVQRPFARGDLIEVAGFTGYVQSVNARSTLLMTRDGNHVQIPNATIYKGNITNFTANPLSRMDFSVGIGYEDSIAQAQSVALSVLRTHEAVVEDPEPVVLVEALAPSTVNLRVYFWLDVTRFSEFKVKSTIIQQVKIALDAAGVSMPDEAREIVFPKGVPVHMLPDKPAVAGSQEKPAPTKSSDVIQPPELDLRSEARDIKAQAKRARTPEGGADLLK